MIYLRIQFESVHKTGYNCNSLSHSHYIRFKARNISRGRRIRKMCISRIPFLSSPYKYIYIYYIFALTWMSSIYNASFFHSIVIIVKFQRLIIADNWGFLGQIDRTLASSDAALATPAFFAWKKKQNMMNSMNAVWPNRHSNAMRYDMCGISHMATNLFIIIRSAHV